MLDFRKLYEAIQELIDEPGKNAKKAIIKKHENVEGFKDILCFQLNTFITTNLATAKISNWVKKNLNNEKIGITKSLETLDELLDYLSEESTGKDQDIANIMTAAIKLSNWDKDVKDMLLLIATKTLKLGMSDKSVNEVFPNLVPMFNIQRANNYKDHAKKLEGKRFWVQEKIDGHRVVIIKNGDNVELYSRSGKRLLGFDNIENQIRQLPEINIMLDGELLLPEIEGVLSSDLFTMSATPIKKDGHPDRDKLIYHVFDMMSPDEFFSGKSNKTYSERRKTIDSDLDSWIHTFELSNIHILPILYEGEDLSQITTITSQLITEGKEGTMVYIDGHYEGRKHSGVLKSKAVNETEGIVLRVEEGSGKYKGMVGNLVVQWREFEVGIGSGLTDQQRKDWFENPDMIVGSVIDILYTDISSNQNGGQSLRFPRFYRQRTDKEAKDVNYA